MEINNNSLLSEFKNKKVFITGHTGFKGSWLTKIFDSSGAITKGYSLVPNTSPSLYNLLTFSENHTSVIEDIRNFDKLKYEIEKFKPDFLFHLAAQPLVIESYIEPKSNFETNFNGTLNVLEALRQLEFSCSCVFITTDKVYENKNKNEVFAESDKLGGKDPYSASKAACEILIKSYRESFFKNSETKIASARAGNVIGGGDWSNNRLIPDVVRSVFENKKLIIRNPNSTRPWQHVLEPIFGYIKLSVEQLKNSEIYSSSWNFGPKNTSGDSVLEILNIIEQKISILNITINKSNPFIEAKTLALNINKAQKTLEWYPKWDTFKSIDKTIEWYKKFYNGKSPNELIINDLNEYLL